MTIDSSSGTPEIVVYGELDVETAPQVAERLNEVLDSGAPVVVVDLGGVPFIDSRGMAALVRGHVRATALGTKFSIRGATGNARRALDLCGLLELLEPN